MLPCVSPRSLTRAAWLLPSEAASATMARGRRYCCLLEEHKRRVLRSRAVLQADQLVDLEECASGLWDMDTQPAAVCRIGVQMPILDRVPKDSGEHGQQL